MGREKSLVFSAAVMQSASKKRGKTYRGAPAASFPEEKKNAISDISTSTESSSYFNYLTVISRSLLDLRYMLRHRGWKKLRTRIT